MAKLNSWTKNTGRYLRDFSIVVAGIAVTLWLQSLLTSNSERNDTKLYLNALKMELQNNRLCTDSALIPAMEKTMRYINYIIDAKTVHPDSIRNYIYVYNNISSYTFYFDAFEMFKTSGNMRFITDKKMLQSIWETYGDLKRTEAWIAKYYQEKLEELRKDNQREMEGKPVAIPMYNFYINYSCKGDIEYNVLRNCKGMSGEIAETILLLEKELQR